MMSDNEEYIVMYLEIDVIAKLAIAAHIRDMKLNDFIVQAAVQRAENLLEDHEGRKNNDKG